jgi:hypothetical protein
VIRVSLRSHGAQLPTELYTSDNCCTATTAALTVVVKYVPLHVALRVSAAPVALRPALPVAADPCERVRGVSNLRMTCDRTHAADGHPAQPQMPFAATPATPALTSSDVTANTSATSTSPLAAAATTPNVWRALDLLSRAGVQISGLTIDVKFLFGPQPAELTYQRVISVNVDGVSGSVVPGHLLALAALAQQMATHFADHDNTVTWDYLPTVQPIHTSLRVRVRRAHLYVWAGASCVDVHCASGLSIAVDVLVTKRRVCVSRLMCACAGARYA